MIEIHSKDFHYNGWHVSLSDEKDELTRVCMAEQIVSILLGEGIGIYAALNKPPEGTK